VTKACFVKSFFHLLRSASGTLTKIVCLLWLIPEKNEKTVDYPKGNSRGLWLMAPEWCAADGLGWKDKNQRFESRVFIEN